jgi:hypothetical protein
MSETRNSKISTTKNLETPNSRDVSPNPPRSPSHISTQKMNIRENFENVIPDKSSLMETRSESNSHNESHRQIPEEKITLNFKNHISTNPTLAKLSKAAKNLINNLLDEIEENFLRRTKGIPITFAVRQSETNSISTNTVTSCTINEDFTPNSNTDNQNSDFKLILERLTKMEQNIEANNKLINNIQHKTSFNVDCSVEKPRESDNAITYANIAANQFHKSSLLIKPKSAKETIKIVNKLQSLKCPDNINILNLKMNKNIIDIKTKNETDKNRLKDFLQKQPISNDLTIEDKTPLRRKVIFYNIPDSLTEEKLIDSINQKLNFTADTDEILVMSKIEGKKANEHWVVSLPRLNAIELTKFKSLQIGFRKIFFKKFFNITRCTVCQTLNEHTAQECKLKRYCSLCAEDHNYKDCRSKTLNCINCELYNKRCLRYSVDKNDPILNQLRNTNHSAASTQCPTFMEKYYEVIESKY